MLTLQESIMKNKISFKSSIYTALLCFIVLCMCFFSLLSPYTLWDPMIKQVDADKLLVLKLVWALKFELNTGLTCLTKSHKKAFFVIYLVLTVLSFVKLVWLFFICG